MNNPHAGRRHLQERSADHHALAERSSDMAGRLLHQRFATLYTQRADTIVVQQD